LFRPDQTANLLAESTFPSVKQVFMDNYDRSAAVDAAVGQIGTEPAKRIVSAGVAVGVLDGIAASANALAHGNDPSKVWQYVASGVLGRHAFDGGAATIALGIVLHFIVALGAAAVFYVISGRFRFLRQRPFFYGPIYGIAVYFFMREVVTPLSLVARIPYTIAGLLTGILIHVIFVGIPIVWIVSREPESLKGTIDEVSGL
jgi:hypothetical protein